MSKLPKSFEKYFWDVEVSKLDLEKKHSFVIQRLLDKGDDEAVRWVRKNYSEEEVENTLTTFRDFDPKIASFWALFLNIPRERIPCLQIPFLQRHKMHWP